MVATMEGNIVARTQIELPEYNGWTNYATWNVALWLDNEQDSYNEYRAFGRTIQHLDPATQLRKLTAYIRRYVNRSWGSSSCSADLWGWAAAYIGTKSSYDRRLQWALNRIDYADLLDSLLREMQEEDEYQSKKNAE